MMANKVYPSFVDLMMNGEVDLEGDTFKVALLDLTEYTYSGLHENLEDVAGVAIVATSDALAGKSVSGGVFDATDPEIADVAGAEVGAALVYKEGVDAANSPLAAYLELAAPVTPNGGAITVEFDAVGIFKIAEPVA